MISAVTAGNVIDPTTFGNAVVDKLNGIVSGSTTASTTAGGDITVTFGVTFASAPVVLATVQTATAQQVACHYPSAASTTAQVVRVTSNDAVLASTSVTIRWVAIGTLA